MKDKEFKSLTKSWLDGINTLRTFNADFEFINTRDEYIILEYENSSRGLLHNLVKILQKVPKNNNVYKLYLIRTNHHIKYHQLDYDRAKFIAENLIIHNLFVTFIDQDQYTESFLNSIK